MQPDMVIPDSITPVVAWRAWAIKGGRLCSVTAGTTWPTRERMEAICHSCSYYYVPGPGSTGVLKKHTESAPVEECQCGIYAAVSELHARGVARAHFASCVGRVALWGKVIEGERGWRAEFAYPLELVLVRNRMMKAGLSAPPALWSRQAVDLLSMTYGVPVTVEGRA